MGRIPTQRARLMAPQRLMHQLEYPFEFLYPNPDSSAIYTLMLQRVRGALGQCFVGTWGEGPLRFPVGF